MPPPTLCAVLSATFRGVCRIPDLDHQKIGSPAIMRRGVLDRWFAVLAESRLLPAEVAPHIDRAADLANSLAVHVGQEK